MEPFTMAMLAMQALPAISQMFSGASGNATSSQYTKDARDQLRRNAAYQEASVDPTHPWSVALQGVIKQMLEQQAANSVTENMRLRRRALAAGNVVSGISSDRLDENNAKAISDAFANAGTQAQMLASNQLARAAGLNQYAPQNYQNLAQQDILMKNTNQQNSFAGITSLLGITAPYLKDLFSGVGGGGGEYGSRGALGYTMRNPTTGLAVGGV